MDLTEDSGAWRRAATAPTRAYSCPPRSGRSLSPRRARPPACQREQQKRRSVRHELVYAPAEALIRGGIPVSAMSGELVCRTLAGGRHQKPLFPVCSQHASIREASLGPALVCCTLRPGGWGGGLSRKVKGHRPVKAG